MDAKLIYVKTPIGDEAVRQSTRVVQRNLRMVLVQVDGKLSVAELSEKIGNPRLVESALRELQDGGFIAVKQGAPGGVLVRDEPRPLVQAPERVSAISQFSTFGGRTPVLAPSIMPESATSHFSSFGKPILPAAGRGAGAAPVSQEAPASRAVERQPSSGRGAAFIRRLLLVPLGIVALLLAIALFYPYARLKPEIETAAASLLQAPVQVGKVGMSFWPAPALLLSDVRVGAQSELLVEQLRVASPLSLLGSARHPLGRVDLLGVTVPADFLVALPMLQSAGAASAGQLLLQRLHVERLAVSAHDVALRDLSGDILFKADGVLDKATLENTEQGIRLAAKPVNEGFLLEIEGFGWKPLGSALGFDSLQAKGMLQKGKLVVQSLDTTFLNGILKGSWLLDWSGSGLAMAGDATLARLDCRKLSAALVPNLKLEGDLAGNLRLRANGKDWESLWRNVEANLDADVTRGMLHGVDLGEAVRRGAGSEVNSGATKFDRLKVALSINARQVSGRDLQMSAGMVTASGQFSAPADRPLEAGLLVTMQTSVATTRTPLRISGVLPNLSAVSGR